MHDFPSRAPAQPEGGAGCVNAHVRICAGGPGRPGSLPCSKALPYPVWIIEATGNGRTSMNQTKSPLRRCLDRKSRVNREVHARFCERPGVKFPRATRPPMADTLRILLGRPCMERRSRGLFRECDRLRLHGRRASGPDKIGAARQVAALESQGMLACREHPRMQQSYVAAEEIVRDHSDGLRLR